MNENRSGKQHRGMQNTLMKSLLVISFGLSVFLVSNCGDYDDIAPIPEPEQLSVGGSPISKLFASAASGAASGAASTASGWALGALGLSDDSPDYTEQLDKIYESLQEIIGQLDAVQEQLAEINNQLQVLNCSAQQTELTAQTGRINSLSILYQSYIAHAADGGRLSNATLSSWVDQVLAEGAYTSQMPMGEILTTMADRLVHPSSGAITACVAAIKIPGNDTFSDVAYYEQVAQFTNYYYYYQALGLMLLNEALHYKAWATAAAEDNDHYSADSVYNVCSDSYAAVYCTKAASFTNAVYNALIKQFTVAGAPYTDSSFLMQNHSSGPRLWVKSLEEFTIASGDNCNAPLTSANNRCGVTVGFYNSGNGAISNKVYRGHTKWQFANASELNTLLGGWTSGTAGNYLESKLGFKHMKSKIVLSTNTTIVSLSNSGANQTVVMFFDGSTGKGKIDNKLFDNSKAFNLIAPNSKTTGNGSCYPFSSNFYSFNGKSAGINSYWYFCWGNAEWCGGNALHGGVKWNATPPWLASSSSDASRQFRLPYTQVKNFNCTRNRFPKNPGGMWTMCGDDFTQWFNNEVPRPESCDTSNSSVSCSAV